MLTGLLLQDGAFNQRMWLPGRVPLLSNFQSDIQAGDCSGVAALHNRNKDGFIYPAVRNTNN